MLLSFRNRNPRGEPPTTLAVLSVRKTELNFSRSAIARKVNARSVRPTHTADDFGRSDHGQALAVELSLIRDVYR